MEYKHTVTVESLQQGLNAFVDTYDQACTAALDAQDRNKEAQTAITARTQKLPYEVQLLSMDNGARLGTTFPARPVIVKTHVPGAGFGAWTREGKAKGETFFSRTEYYIYGKNAAGTSLNPEQLTAQPFTGEGDKDKSRNWTLTLKRRWSEFKWLGEWITISPDNEYAEIYDEINIVKGHCSSPDNTVKNEIKNEFTQVTEYLRRRVTHLVDQLNAYLVKQLGDTVNESKLEQNAAVGQEKLDQIDHCLVETKHLLIEFFKRYLSDLNPNLGVKPNRSDLRKVCLPLIDAYQVQTALNFSSGAKAGMGFATTGGVIIGSGFGLFIGFLIGAFIISTGGLVGVGAVLMQILQILIGPMSYPSLLGWLGAAIGAAFGGGITHYLTKRAIIESDPMKYSAEKIATATQKVLFTSVPALAIENQKEASLASEKPRAKSELHVETNPQQTCKVMTGFGSGGVKKSDQVVKTPPSMPLVDKSKITGISSPPQGLGPETSPSNVSERGASASPTSQAAVDNNAEISLKPSVNSRAVQSYRYQVSLSRNSNTQTSVGSVSLDSTISTGGYESDDDLEYFFRDDGPYNNPSSLSGTTSQGQNPALGSSASYTPPVTQEPTSGSTGGKIGTFQIPAHIPANYNSRSTLGKGNPSQ